MPHCIATISLGNRIVQAVLCLFVTHIPCRVYIRGEDKSIDTDDNEWMNESRERWLNEEFPSSICFPQQMSFINKRPFLFPSLWLFEESFAGSFCVPRWSMWHVADWFEGKQWELKGTKSTDNWTLVCLSFVFIYLRPSPVRRWIRYGKNEWII